jgi:hypothetical protein
MKIVCVMGLVVGILLSGEPKRELLAEPNAKTPAIEPDRMVVVLWDVGSGKSFYSQGYWISSSSTFSGRGTPLGSHAIKV